MIKKLLTWGIIAFLGLAPLVALGQENTQDETELKEAASELVPFIGSDGFIQINKKAIFDASESLLIPDISEEAKYTWDFGDKTPAETGQEVLHTFTEIGKYKVTLTINQDGNVEESIKEIFVFDQKTLLITDKDEESLAAIVNEAEKQGTWLKIVSAISEDVGFITEDTLVGKIAAETEFIKDIDAIVFYTKSSLGLQAFSRFWRDIENKDEFEIREKILTKITDEGIATMARLTEQSFNIIKPRFILVTRKEAFSPIFSNTNSGELLLSLGQKNIEYQIVDDRSKKPAYFVLSRAVTNLISNGIPTSALYLILALPFITFFIAFARQVIGISTFGVYTPTMLTLAFMILGVSFGSIVLLIVVLISYLLRVLFSKVSLLYIPKVALLLSLVSLSFLGIIWFVVYTGSNVPIALAIFPMLVMSTISEKLVSTQSEEGIKSAILATAETIIVALIAYYFVVWGSFADTLMSTPEMVVLPLIGTVILGKFTGLRLTEYFRFRSLIKGDFEE